jgi:hypothetical protein
MKTWKVVIICLVIGLIVGSIGGGIAVYQLTRPEADIIAHEPDAPVYYQPVDVVQSSGAGIITISGVLSGNIFSATARNNFMSVTRKFELAIPKPKVRHHAISAGYAFMYDIDSRLMRHNVDVMYHYQWFNRVILGAGPVVQFADSKVYQVGARIEGRLNI